MKLDDIRARFPTAYALVVPLLDANLIDHRCFETLSWDALQRIESGETPQCDAVRMFVARSTKIRLLS